MTDLVLFHSAYGLRPAVVAAAERIRGIGLRVHTPDLFDGRTADTVEEGRAIRDEIGVPALIERARAAVAALDLGPGTIYGGFSMGAAAAQLLGCADRSTGALVLLHGAAEVEGESGFDFPIQLHVAEGDEFATAEEVEEWERAVRSRGGAPEVYWYAGGGHLYTDPGLADYDAKSAELTWQRVERFLHPRR